MVGGPGGPPSDKFAWAQNPMIGLTLTTTTSVGVVLSQKDERWETFAGPGSLRFAFHVCRLSKKKRRVHTLWRKKVVASSGKYSLDRNVTALEALPAGDYVVVPSLMKSGDEGSYRIEVYVDDAVRGGKRTDFHFASGDVGLQLEQVPPEGGSDDEGDGVDVACEEQAFPQAGEDLVDTEILNIRCMHASQHALMAKIDRLASEISSIQDIVADLEAKS